MTGKKIIVNKGVTSHRKNSVLTACRDQKPKNYDLRLFEKGLLHTYFSRYTCTFLKTWYSLFFEGTQKRKIKMVNFSKAPDGLFGSITTPT